MTGPHREFARRLDRASRQRGAAWLAVALLVGFCGIELLGPLVRRGALTPDVLGDFAINLSLGTRTLDALEYVPHFYYPPPFVLLQGMLEQLGTAGSAALWLSLLFAASVVSPFLAIDLAGRSRDARRVVLAVLGVVAVLYFVQWDLRATNHNLLVLACVLGALTAREHDRLVSAGVLLAVAIALKLYAALLVPYLLWRGELRWLAFCAAAGLVLFVAWPVASLGLDGAVTLTSSWLASFGQALDPTTMPDYYKSLERSLWLVLVDPEARSGGLPQAGRVLLRTTQAAWLGLAALHLVRGRADTSMQRRFRDVGVLLLLPLPFSPTFQVHHAVVAMIASIWGVVVVTDFARPSRERIVAAALLVGAIAIVKLVGEWPARALAIQLALASYLAVLVCFDAREDAISVGVEARS